MKIHPLGDRLVFRKLTKKAVVTAAGIKLVEHKSANRLEQIIGEVVAVGDECIKKYAGSSSLKEPFEVGDIILVQPPTVENMTMYEAYEDGDDEFLITWDYHIMGLVEGFDAE